MNDSFMPLKLNFSAPYRFKEGILKQAGAVVNINENKIKKLFNDNVFSSGHIDILILIGKYNCLTGYQIKLMMKKEYISHRQAKIRISKAISDMVNSGVILRRYIDYANMELESDTNDIKKEDDCFPSMDKMEKRSVYFYSLAPGTIYFLNKRYGKNFDPAETLDNSVDILTCLSTNQFIAEFLNKVSGKEMLILKDRRVMNPDTNIIVTADVFIYSKREYIIFNCRRKPDWIDILTQRIQSICYFIKEMYGNESTTIKPIIIFICEDDTQIVEAYPIIKKHDNSDCSIMFTTDMRVVDEYFSNSLIVVEEEKNYLLLNEILSPLTNES